MSAALIPETLSISDMDSDKLMVGSAVVLSVNATESDSVMSDSLTIPSSSEIVSERKTLTVPDNSMPVSREIVSSSEIPAILEILSVSDNDSDIGTVLVPALETLSVRDRDSADSVMSELLVILSSSNIVSDNEMSASLIPETLDRKSVV